MPCFVVSIKVCTHLMCLVAIGEMDVMARRRLVDGLVVGMMNMSQDPVDNPGLYKASTGRMEEMKRGTMWKVGRVSLRR